MRESVLTAPKGSRVLQKQSALIKATNEALTAIVKDVRGGLLETVGVESSFSIDNDRCSVILELPDGTDTELIARAIDAENIETWRDGSEKVHVAISPWLSTKDVDQTVLCATKVIHVLLGLHAADNASPKSLGQKIMTAIRDIMVAQQVSAKRKD